jgi:hypothetical protein
MAQFQVLLAELQHQHSNHRAADQAKKKFEHFGRESVVIGNLSFVICHLSFVICHLSLSFVPCHMLAEPVSRTDVGQPTTHN